MTNDVSNQFSSIILSYLNLEQCSGLVGNDQYLTLWNANENNLAGLDLFMKEGVKVAYENLKKKYLANNGQVRWLKKENISSDTTAPALEKTVLDKIVKIRNSIFQSTTTEVIPEDTLSNLIPSAIEEWLSGVSPQNLIAAFTKANDEGDFEIVQKIIDSKKLTTTITDAELINTRDIALKQAFKTAASKGFIENLRAIMDSDIFKLIPDYIQGEALIKAANGGYSDVVIEILKKGHVTNEKVGEVLLIAATKNLLEVVREICNNKKFKISDNDLKKAFERAGDKGFFDIVSLFMSSRFSSDIPANSLGVVLGWAIQSTYLNIATAILSSPRLSEIHRNYLLKALISASDKGNLAVVSFLVNLDVNREIFQDNYRLAWNKAVLSTQKNFDLIRLLGPLTGFTPSEVEEEIQNYTNNN